MKKLILLFFIIFTNAFAYKNSIKGIYAIGIFDSKGKGENIQHVKKTKADYNGTCYVKVFVYGTVLKIKPIVKIGNSFGQYKSSKSIFNKKNIKIGEELLFKHYNVSKGLIQVIYRNKVYDSKVYVK